MKSIFSKSWVSSKQPRKQRKYRYNAPDHIKKKFKVHMYNIPLKPDELDSIIDYLKYHSQ